MFFIFRRVLFSSPKTFISDKNFSLPTITSLNTLIHDVKTQNLSNKSPGLKILQPVQVQHRYYSIDFNDSLYQAATTTEATKYITNLLIKAHDISGLHWWGTLIAASLVLKLIYSFPCAIYQNKLNAKIELITLESKPLVENIKREIMIEGRQKKWPPERMQRKFKAETKELMKKITIDNNIHPFKLVILSLIQLPPWILLTMSISKLGTEVSSGTLDSVKAALQYQVGGPFWSPDLSASDPTFILPTALLVLSVASFEINWLLKPQRETQVLRILKILYRLFSGVLFYIALQVSSGLSLYWTSNAVFGLVQNLLLFSPRFRRMLRIPKTSSEHEKPYSHLISQVKNKLTSLFLKK